MKYTYLQEPIHTWLIAARIVKVNVSEPNTRPKKKPNLHMEKYFDIQP